jgi:hypothetical protein
LVWAACGGGESEGYSVHKEPPGAMAGTGSATSTTHPDRGCDQVEMDGEYVVEHETDFTARFQVGDRYTKTVMLFGGAPVEDENVLSNAYIFGLDKQDALMLAKKYPDFSNCRSPGGQEASKYIISYDLVPATCDVYDRITAALRQYDANVANSGDRTSLRFDGAPLRLESVTADATGEDVTAQVTDKNFQLVTAVEQLTGESVVSFGTTE